MNMSLNNLNNRLFQGEDKTIKKRTRLQGKRSCFMITMASRTAIGVIRFPATRPRDRASCPPRNQRKRMRHRTMRKQDAKSEWPGRAIRAAVLDPDATTAHSMS